MLDKTQNWFSRVWASRLNDPKRDSMLVIQQRTNERDLTGYLLAGEDGDEWVHLCLPLEFEASRKSKTIILPGTNKVWEDPRTEEGQLLCPGRIGPKELIELKSKLRDQYTIAGQLQQRPAPSSGGMIRRDWFKLWKDIKPPKLLYIVQSWDTALEAHENNCYSACTTWGVFENYEHTADTLDAYNTATPVPNIILLSMWRGRVEYPDLRAMAKRLYNDYRDDGSNPNHIVKARTPDKVLVEAKVNGYSLIHDLTRAGIPAVGFNPNKYGDKIQRVRLVSSLIECGKVWLPARAPDFKVPLSYADILREECCLFPNGASRDLIDTMTQTLLNLKQNGWISHAKDDDRADTSVKTPQGLYY